MHTYQTCVIHGCDLIINEKDKVGVLDNKLNNFYNLIWYVLSNPIMPMFFGVKSKFHKLIYGSKILIVSHWFTFIQ
jgi:hypothetical protein